MHLSLLMDNVQQCLKPILMSLTMFVTVGYKCHETQHPVSL